MSASMQQGARSGMPATAAVRCVKCGRANDPALADCAGCGAHLWVVCQECEAKNRRCDTTCARCGRRMRKAHRSRVREGGRAEGRLWIGVAVIAVLLAVLAGLAVVLGRSRVSGALGFASEGGLA